MFNYEDFYKLYNCRSEARYQELREKLASMIKQMTATKERGFREKMFWYAKAQGEYLLLLTKLEEKWTKEYRDTALLADMKQDQELLFGELSSSQYGKSYLNPKYMASFIGKELGPVLAAVAKMFKDAVQDAYCHRRFLLADRIEFYFELYKKITHGQVRAEQIVDLIKQYRLVHAGIEAELDFHKQYNVSDAALTDLLDSEDLSQPYYLYQLGMPVGEQEESLQRFFAALPQEKIDRMAKTMIEGFKKGFIRNNKDMRKKSAVAIDCPIGMERLVKKVMDLCRTELSMEPFVANMFSSQINRQYEYDHRYDYGLYLNEAYCEKQKEAMQKVLQENAGLLHGFGGIIELEGFGEAFFVPEFCEEALDLTEEQSKLVEEMQQYYEQEKYRIGRLHESSYTMMALPVPAISEHFEEIFNEMVQINTMEEEHIAKAQQALIQALGRGSEVHVTGREGNETDIRIALQPLSSPKKQTNFMNCLADVNLPAGEVFTSPQLKGTNGLLHLDAVEINGLRYENLQLLFENGCVKEYSCTNFEDAELGKAYVYENLLDMQEGLPMGEFAIGTNTWAYCTAQKFDILQKLPTLILEKTGPHFAIGDTCFAYEEEIPVFNPLDHKEVVAKDNERSILRRSEPEKAYTQKHTDLTLPYDRIGRISVVKEDGSELDLIRGGRFVLIGTDMLNVPIMAMQNELGGEFYGRI